MSTAERVVQLIEENPSRSTADLAALTGVSRERIHQILKVRGYEFFQVQEWRKANGKSA